MHFYAMLLGDKWVIYVRYLADGFQENWASHGHGFQAFQHSSFCVFLLRVKIIRKCISGHDKGHVSHFHEYPCIEVRNWQSMIIIIIKTKGHRSF